MKFLLIILYFLLLVSCKNVLTSGNASMVDLNYHPGMDSQDLLLPQAFDLSLNTVSDSELIVDWTTSAHANSYTLKYGTSPGVYDTVFSSNAVSPTTVTGLTNGVNYYFRVEAHNVNGTRDNNLELQAMPMTPPTTPTTLQISSTAPYTININWTNEGGLGTVTYNIYRSLSSGVGYSLIASSVNALSYSDTGLVGGQTYFYIITAHNEAGNSGYSNEITSIAP